MVVEQRRGTHETERDLDSRKSRVVLVQHDVVRVLRGGCLDHLEDVACGDFTLEKSVVPRVDSTESVRSIADREDVLRSHARTRILLDLGLGLVLVFVGDGGLRLRRDRWCEIGSRVVGDRKLGKLFWKLVGRDGFRELQGSADACHALVGAVSDDGVREDVTEERGVRCLTGTEQLHDEP